MLYNIIKIPVVTFCHLVIFIIQLPSTILFHFALRRSQRVQLKISQRLKKERTQHWKIKTDYNDYRDAIKKMMDEGVNLLCSSPVRLLEPTSGTQTGTKYIPYTDSLKKEFSRAVAPWINGIYRRYPKIFFGTHFWVVSPIAKDQKKSQIPVGFDSDSAYLGKLEALLLRFTLTVPESVRLIKDRNEYMIIVSLYLLLEKNIRFISIWSPTYLLQLTSYILDNRERLIDVFHQQNLNLSLQVPKEIRSGLNKKILREKSRCEILKNFLSCDEYDWTNIWPSLSVISCWCDGSAAMQLPMLKKQFPGVEIDPKGLVATEGIISLPIGYDRKLVPAVRSHYLEFENRSSGEICGLDKLKEEQEYSPLLTTGNGFYRYKLGDIITLSGFHSSGVPLLKFMGRDSCWIDITGEKMEEQFVQKILSEQLTEGEFAILFAIDWKEKISYSLVTECQAITEKVIDKALSGNFHYKNSRTTGQLAEANVVVIPVGSGLRRYYKYINELNGMRYGAIKPQCLSNCKDLYTAITQENYA